MAHPSFLWACMQQSVHIDSLNIYDRVALGQALQGKSKACMTREESSSEMLSSHSVVIGRIPQKEDTIQKIGKWYTSSGIHMELCGARQTVFRPCLVF